MPGFDTGMWLVLVYGLSKPRFPVEEVIRLLSIN